MCVVCLLDRLGDELSFLQDSQSFSVVASLCFPPSS